VKSTRKYYRYEQSPVAICGKNCLSIQKPDLFQTHGVRRRAAQLLSRPSRSGQSVRVRLRYHFGPGGKTAYGTASLEHHS